MTKLSDFKLYCLLSVRCFMFIIVFILGSMLLNKELPEISKWWPVIVSILNIVTILMLLRYCKSKKISYAMLINYRKGETKAASVVWTSFLFILLGMGGMYIAGFLCYGQLPYLATMMIQPIPILLATVNSVVLPLTTTLAEDGLYLGIGVNSIKNAKARILIPAFFFAIQHSFIPTLFDFQYVLYRFLSFLPLTIVICHLYRKKRNPVPIMTGHFVINIATVVQIVMTSASPEFFKMMSSMIIHQC